jgi:hypothetical protein
MADEASIRMTVDSSQATTENQKYVRAAKEGFQSLLDQSEHLNSNYQKRAQFLQREIELLKERNRLEVKENIATEHQLYAKGVITGKERTADITNIRQEAAGEESKINDIARLNKQWNIEQKELQKEQLSTQKEELRLEKQQAAEQKAYQQKAERAGSDVTRGMSGIFPGMMGAGNVQGALGAGIGGLTAGLGIAGILGSILISKAIRGAATMEPAMADYALLRGQKLYDTQKEVGGLDVERLSKLGITPSQFYSGSAQLNRATGGRLNEAPMGIMAAEIATGVSRSQMTNLLGVERYGGGQVTPILSFFDKYLRSTQQSIALLPEILQTFAQEGTRMMQLTGKVNTEAIASTVAVVGKQFGFTGAPLQTVVGALSQGLQQSSNPVIQALQYSAMSKAMPGASLWQMQLAMENPLAKPEYITGMLDQLKGISGGGEQYARTLYNTFGQFGLSANLADQMSRGTAGTGDFSKAIDEYRKTGVGGYEGRAGDLKGVIEQTTASMIGLFEKQGFTGGTKDMVESLNKAFIGLGEVAGRIETSINNWETDQMEKIAKSNSLLEQMLIYAKTKLLTPRVP